MDLVKKTKVFFAVVVIAPPPPHPSASTAQTAGISPLSVFLSISSFFAYNGFSKGFEGEGQYKNNIKEESSFVIFVQFILLLNC